ncbi:uncharacterized protein LOC121726034 [Aricia agestis]|uniref:uncharacterized protein LOC121726034 n=1 Tax=Aricia agestis TaxID=91739 RepID=UPI001C209C6C|nr:uncharacterized protein LOC121726034 [Aricia agestis]
MKYKLRKKYYKYENVNLPNTSWRVSTKTMLVALLGLSCFVTGYFYPRCAPSDLVPKLEKPQKSDNYVKNMGLIKKLHKELNVKYILLWTPQNYAPFYFFKEGNRIFIENKCAWTSCYVTANRNLLGEDVSKFHAIAFNGRSNNIDPPKARLPRQKYVFFNMESADNYPVCSSRWDGFFNWTATYRLDSDIPFPYIQIRNQKGEVVGPKPNMKWQDAESDAGYDFRQNKTKAVAWFVSNCKSRSDRRRVAADLAEALKMYGLTVDIYGSCGDHTCPRFDEKYDCGNVLKREYFFYLSFENSFSEDYVTEKLLTALQHDVVPIVLGGADYSQFLPPGSYLNAGNTSSEDLASAIDRLIRSPSEYNKFFRWKTLYRYRDPSTTDSVCAMCAALHNHTLLTHRTSYTNFRQWCYQNNNVPEDLIKEALDNVAKDVRYTAIYRKIDKLPKDMKYLLFWTPVEYAPLYYFKDGQRAFIDKNCSDINCYVTSDRNLFKGDLSRFDAIGFNGRTMYERRDSGLELPSSRYSHQKYIYFNLESADNYPICNSEWDGFFNWTATYRLDSDIPFPYIQIRNQGGEVVGPKRNMKWQEYSDSEELIDYRQNKTKAVAWFVSHCSSRSGRKLFANHIQKELKNYNLKLDIYGSCGPLKCPRHTDHCMRMLERDYFFYLSFENSFSEDYVTEKLLTALQHDVVPIVLGGADYSRFLPPGSYLDALETSPRELAAKINDIMNSPSEYNKFFRWKTLYRYRDPSTTDSVCAMCAALHNHTLLTHRTSYTNFKHWWNPFYVQRCKPVD